MDPLEAYELCRKRAYRKWQPTKNQTFEDIAHDAWITWLDHKRIHPYVLVDATIGNWLHYCTAMKRSPSKTQELIDVGRNDDPSAEMVVAEELAAALEAMIKSSRKESIRHVTELILQGYRIKEIQADNDYSRIFISNVMRKLRQHMPPDLAEASKTNRSRGNRNAMIVRNRARERGRRLRYIKNEQ